MAFLSSDLDGPISISPDKSQIVLTFEETENQIFSSGFPFQMAPQSSSKLLLVLLTLTAVFFFSASARPYKVLIRSYHFPLEPRHNRDNILYSSPRKFTLITEIDLLSSSEINLVLPSGKSSSQIPLLEEGVVTVPLVSRPHLRYIRGEPRPAIPFGFSFDDSKSIRRRSKDILNVLFSLFLGVGCGAITGAALCLIWSLSSFVHEHLYATDEGEYEEHPGDDFSPEKMGYVKIPGADSVPEPIKSAV